MVPCAGRTDLHGDSLDESEGRYARAYEGQYSLASFLSFCYYHTDLLGHFLDVSEGQHPRARQLDSRNLQVVRVSNACDKSATNTCDNSQQAQGTP